MSRNKALFSQMSRLIARRNALRKTLAGDHDAVSEVTGVGDLVDAAVDSVNDDIFAQLVEIESRELAQIEHALQRIALGVYGRCESCGGKIPSFRLNAIPYACKCIKCQHENEKREYSGAPADVSARSAEADKRPIDGIDGDEQIDLRKFESDLIVSGHRL
jgi:DnaK suppressor protein